MTKNFKKGDIVVCIDKGLFAFPQIGQKYIVNNVCRDYISLKTLDTGYITSTNYPSRLFRIAGKTNPNCSSIILGEYNEF